MEDMRFTAKEYVDYYTTQKGITIEDLRVTSTVVVTWFPKLVETMVEESKATPSKRSFFKHLYTGEIKGKSVSIALLPVGAPGTVMNMEEMIACGAKRFIGLGYAGSLQPNIPIGQFIIPTQCIHEEGTSLHYIGNDRSSVPNQSLVNHLKEACQSKGVHPFTGLHWTTDAIYRESISKLSTYREKGVLGVDMETSAMYALGEVKNIDVCNLLVISDELWQKWSPGFHEEELDHAAHLAKDIIFECIAPL